MKRLNRKGKEDVRNLPLKVKAERAMKEAVAWSAGRAQAPRESYCRLAEWEGGLDTAGRNRCAGSIVQCNGYPVLFFLTHDGLFLKKGNRMVEKVTKGA